MPRISLFLGIAIYMYYGDMDRHHAPHIHALYGDNEASFSIETGTLIAGKMSKRQERRVREWIEARRNELLENWERAQRKEPLKWVSPL